jgi:hypothetical protein
MKCKRAVPKAAGNLCRVMLLVLVMALPIAFFQVAHASETFAATDYFAIPELNGRIYFAGGGYYSNASISNGTWHFTDLIFAGAKGVFPPGKFPPPIPGFNGATTLSVSAENCDVTITRLDLVNVFPPWSGWLEYTVVGAGTQTINLHYSPNALWLGYTVYVDGVAKAQNDGWSVTKDGWLTVTGATSNVKIQYECASVDVAAADVFPIPALNSSINFAFDGTYVYASLENDTWRIQNLVMNEHERTGGVSTWALGVSALDCNVTIISYRALGRPDQGWVNYTVAGVGDQIFKIDYDKFNSWPINYTVCVDGAARAQNDSWTLSKDGWLTITGATSNVSISFLLIVPEDVKNLPPPGIDAVERGLNGYFYAVIAVLIIAISATTVLMFRRKKETRTKKLAST